MQCQHLFAFVSSEAKHASMLSGSCVMYMLSVHTVLRRLVGGVIRMSERKRGVRAGVKISGQGTAACP